MPCWPMPPAPGSSPTEDRSWSRCGAGSGWPRTRQGRIHIPAADPRGRWALTRSVVLHEVAHHLSGVPGHGSSFRAALVALYDRHISPGAAELLAAPVRPDRRRPRARRRRGRPRRAGPPGGRAAGQGGVDGQRRGGGGLPGQGRPGRPAPQRGHGRGGDGPGRASRRPHASDADDRRAPPRPEQAAGQPDGGHRPCVVGAGRHRPRLDLRPGVRDARRTSTGSRPCSPPRAP